MTRYMVSLTYLYEDYETEHWVVNVEDPGSPGLPLLMPNLAQFQGDFTSREQAIHYVLHVLNGELGTCEQGF